MQQIFFKYSILACLASSTAGSAYAVNSQLAVPPSFSDQEVIKCKSEFLALDSASNLSSRFEVLLLPTSGSSYGPSTLQVYSESLWRDGAYSKGQLELSAVETNHRGEVIGWVGGYWGSEDREHFFKIDIEKMSGEYHDVYSSDIRDNPELYLVYPLSCSKTSL